MREFSTCRRLAVLLLVISTWGCGSESSSSVGAGATTSATEAADSALAVLGVISTEVTVSSAEGDADAEEAHSDDPLGEGDVVETDAAGFAEIKFFDGSLTRVDHDAAFEIVELVEEDNAEVVSSELLKGRSWNRISRLSESQEWSQEAPVGNATVRGTAFLVDCSVEGRCTLVVFEGVVELSLPDGTTLEVLAGEQISIEVDGTGIEGPMPIETSYQQDPWVLENLELDVGVGFQSLELAASESGEVPCTDWSPPPSAGVPAWWPEAAPQPGEGISGYQVWWPEDGKTNEDPPPQDAMLSVYVCSDDPQAAAAAYIELLNASLPVAASSEWMGMTFWEVGGYTLDIPEVDDTSTYFTVRLQPCSIGGLCSDPAASGDMGPTGTGPLRPPVTSGGGTGHLEEEPADPGIVVEPE